MGMKYIDASQLKRAFLAGAKSLEAKKEWINELNVFPVPDGDTGTNMTMTIMAAAREVAAIEKPDMEALAKAISSGSLRGARGNSGVILSQLFRGFTKEIKNVDKITATTLANAFVRGTETAYKAVMKPKEGTILTVARGMADKAAQLVAETEDILEFCRKVVEHGDYVLSQTPEMLPVLKQAGVVDSGGQGLMVVLKGALDCLFGKEMDLSVADGPGKALEGGEREETPWEIRYGYCTEFIVNLEGQREDKAERELKAYLESIGDSLVVVSDDGIVKVHVHTNDPGLALQKALSFGSLSHMKIDNMREEHQEKLIKDSERLAAQQKEAGRNGTALTAAGKAGASGGKQAASGTSVPKKPYGFISVSVGEGLSDIFRGIGADYLIEGGQTMNPSTEDLLNAIELVNADTIYLLPNNKNIILAAEQAKQLSMDKHIIVIPSTTIPQGITALINFAPDLSPEENEAVMTEEMKRVKTGQITYAVRSTKIDDKEIKEGDIIALGDHGILSVGYSVEDTALEALEAMVEEDSELLTIYYGTDLSETEAGELYKKARERFTGCEVELHAGGQPIYYYLISVE